MARSTIEFNTAADRQLDYLAETLDIKSKAEVVRNALSLYAYLVDLLQKKPSRALGIVDEDQDNRIEKIILVPGIYHSAPLPSNQEAAVETVASAR